MSTPEILTEKAQRTVISRRLSQFLKSQFELTSLTEITKATFGNVTIEPLASTHLKVSAPNQQELDKFLAPFTTKRRRRK